MAKSAIKGGGGRRLMAKVMKNFHFLFVDPSLEGDLGIQFTVTFCSTSCPFEKEYLPSLAVLSLP